MTNAYIYLLFCLLYCGVNSSFSNEAIDEWIQGRCGDGSAVWTYEGTLYDPLDGRKICQVEGIELVRTLAGPNDSSSRRVGLISKDLEGSTTVLSRKLFCYKSPKEPHKLLSSIKLRHNSPKRLVPTNQAVAVYDTATTLSSRHDGKQLVLHTEFPNGKCYWASAESSDEPSEEAASKSLDFTVYTKKRSTDLPELLDEPKNGDVIVAPKRSRLIQFGASPKQEVGRFGARETYSYTLSKAPIEKRSWKFWEKQIESPPNCSVKYTRYGEGPPWYGPGKYCTLELKGRRLNSSDGVKPLAAAMAAQIPGFLSVDNRIETDGQAKQAVTRFRKQGLFQLDAEPSVEDKLKERAMKALRKLRSASSHVTEKFSST